MAELRVDEVQADEVKAVVRTHWDGRAATFDDMVHHAIHSDAQEEAWLRLLGEVFPRAGLRVLDIGSGTGFLSLLLAGMRYTVGGIDIAPSMVERARVKASKAGLAVRFSVGDAESLGAADGTYDAVIARHVIWTVPRPDVALREWARVLRPGVQVVLIEGNWGPNQNADYEPIRESLPLIGGRPASDVVALMEAAGFQQVRVIELSGTALWGGEQRGERYVLVGVRAG